MDDKDRYSEVGNNYRFFLTWRYGTVAALVAVFYFGIQLYLETVKNNPALGKYIAIGVILTTILLWISELRTRDLYRAAQREGKRLEAGRGIYEEFSKTPPRLQVWSDDQNQDRIGKAIYSGFSHSLGVNYLAIGIIVAMGGLMIFYPKVSKVDSEKDQVQEIETRIKTDAALNDSIRNNINRLTDEVFNLKQLLEKKQASVVIPPKKPNPNPSSR